ncbi:hypothetical protein JYT89_02385 [Flavobacteriaceae bacterium AH-315-B10]|nr:hypothetical protein [Flavobacteriaceae bacterium AH-315-B10]
MKKVILITILAGSLFAACTCNNKKEVKETSVETIKESELPDSTTQEKLDLEIKEARTLDSIRQVKEHGHAH